MRELIKAEERLMFARYNPDRPLRKETEALVRPSDAHRSPVRLRILLSRKELY